MRHRYANKKFGQGQDSNEMLTRKLIVNFLNHGKITTTEAKAKYLKGRIDRVITLAKRGTESSKNRLLTVLGDRVLTGALMAQAPEAFNKRVSGYTSSRRLKRRQGDAVMEMELTWVDQILLDTKLKKAKKADSGQKSVEKPVVVKKPVAVKKAPEKKVVAKKATK